MSIEQRFFAIMLLAVSAAVGEVHAQNKVAMLLRTVGDYLDQAARRHVDSLYIEVPQERWSVMARANFDQVSLTMTHERRDDYAILGLEPTVSTGLKTAVGLRASYRTLSVGYQLKLGPHGGGNLTFGSNGNRFGLSMRMRNMQTSSPRTHFYILNGPKAFSDDTFDHVQIIELESPIRIKSMLIDGYYVFNNRHYSNGATNALAFIQRKSAGSILAGASWLKASADYADNGNWSYISLVNSIGRIRLHQINLSAGYGYNWVPQRDWVVNLTVMPQLTVYNWLELDYYDATVIGDEDEFYPDVEIKPANTVSENSRLKLSWTGRMAVAYNHRCFVASAVAQFKQFRYKHSANHDHPVLPYSQQTNGRLTDWTGSVSVGWRF